MTIQGWPVFLFWTVIMIVATTGAVVAVYHSDLEGFWKFYVILMLITQAIIRLIDSIPEP